MCALCLHILISEASNVFTVCLHMQADIIAGVSVGAMVIPQGMSYAKLAGLPNVYGLYGAFVPVMIYAILGSSPQLVSNQCLTTK